MGQAETTCRSAEAAVEMSRRRLADVAGRSGAWLEQQKQRTERRQQLQSSLTPLLQEQQQLQERLRQDAERLEELGGEQQQDGADEQAVLQRISSGKQALQQSADSLAVQQRTRTRLELL